MLPAQVILGTVLSEKAIGIKESLNKYTFLVAVKASKSQITAALKKVYNVDAVSVTTSITRGKSVRKMASRKGPAIQVTKPKKKKAFVTLKSGQSIPTLYDQTNSVEAK